jgi:hypothetical protein
MGERRTRCGSGSIAERNPRSAAVAAASVTPRPGSRYIRRAQRGSSATASAASPPQAGWAGVRNRTQGRIGGTVISRKASIAAGVTASSGRLSSKYAASAATDDGTAERGTPISSAVVACSCR